MHTIRLWAYLRHSATNQSVLKHYSTEKTEKAIVNLDTHTYTHVQTLRHTHSGTHRAVRICTTEMTNKSSNLSAFIQLIQLQQANERNTFMSVLWFKNFIQNETALRGYSFHTVKHSEREKERERKWKPRDRKCHTYIQFCSSIKPILVHHTERQKNKMTAKRKKEKKKKKMEEEKIIWTGRHHVVIKVKTKQKKMAGQM